MKTGYFYAYLSIGKLEWPRDDPKFCTNVEIKLLK